MSDLVKDLAAHIGPKMLDRINATASLIEDRTDRLVFFWFILCKLAESVITTSLETGMTEQTINESISHLSRHMNDVIMALHLENHKNTMEVQ